MRELEPLRPMQTPGRDQSAWAGRYGWKCRATKPFGIDRRMVHAGLLRLETICLTNADHVGRYAMHSVRTVEYFSQNLRACRVGDRTYALGGTSATHKQPRVSEERKGVDAACRNSAVLEVDHIESRKR